MNSMTVNRAGFTRRWHYALAFIAGMAFTAAGILALAMASLPPATDHMETDPLPVTVPVVFSDAGPVNVLVNASAPEAEYAG